MAELLEKKLQAEGLKLIDEINTAAAAAALECWTTVCNASATNWHLKERIVYEQKSFFSSAAPDNTFHRTMTLSVDITSSLDKHLAAHKTRHGDRVSEDAFRGSYGAFVKRNLVQHMGTTTNLTCEVGSWSTMASPLSDLKDVPRVEKYYIAVKFTYAWDSK